MSTYISRKKVILLLVILSCGFSTSILHAQTATTSDVSLATSTDASFATSSPVTATTTPPAAATSTPTPTPQTPVPTPAPVSDGTDADHVLGWRLTPAMKNNISLLSQSPVQDLFVPILFGVSLKNITPNFGDPRSNGRTHEGEDIMAPRGSPVISATDAVVVFVGYDAGGGNSVYTANPGGEAFVYMHLDQPSTLKSGDVLKAGDFIGFVGNTGDAAGGATHLHFEIRKNGATNPFPRLKRDLTLQEKMQFLFTIISKINDRTTFSDTLVQNNLPDFINAKSQNISMPQDITDALNRLSAKVVTDSGDSDFSFGITSAAVRALQNFLIIQNRGPQALLLANNGATGYFGTLTKAALTEYQNTIGVSPSGQYDAGTRAFMRTGSVTFNPTPVPAIIPVTTPVITTTASTTGTATATTSATTTSTVPNSTTPTPSANVLSGTVPTHDLATNMSGADVVWLQTFLIKANAGPAVQNLITATATGYFGAFTRKALAEYQAKNNISPAIGYFGPITRAYVLTHPNAN